jgi:putative transcriptional regulator
VLPEAFDLAVATHLSRCATNAVRGTIARESVGGAVLEDTETVEMDAGALDAVLALIGWHPPRGAGRPRMMPSGARFGAKDSGAAACRLPIMPAAGLPRSNWRSVGGGVRQAVLARSDDGATARLLHIPGGTAVPDHSATTVWRLTLGAGRGVSATAGQRYRARRRADRRRDGGPYPGGRGRPAACICLAVTEGRLKFSGLLPRLAQPFLRI